VIGAWALVAVIVGATALADVLQALGMKRHGEIDEFHPSAIGRALARLAGNWYVIAAVLAMAVSFFAFLKLLSITDLSFAVPATAASYVVETLAARHILKERVNWKRWTGAGLVACGVALLAL
jgi:drug/metabolite transporter (DMT)-like permease